MRVFIYGAGKVGTTLARAARGAGVHVRLRPARSSLPQRRIEADLLILAIRDRDLRTVAARLRDEGKVGRATACVHCAGALDSSALAPLRSVSAGVAQMHPLVSFASRAFGPDLRDTQVHVEGDPRAVRMASRFVRAIGMRPWHGPKLETVGYHAAAALTANGAVGLVAAAAALLRASNVPKDRIDPLLGSLLRTVADNVEGLGLPEALTGPIRRGEVDAVERHFATLQRLAPESLPLYLACARAQLPLARRLAEAPTSAFDAIAQWLESHDKASRTLRRPAPRPPRARG